MQGIDQYSLYIFQAVVLIMAFIIVYQMQLLRSKAGKQILERKIERYSVAMKLTDREIEVLKFIIDGKENKEIAEILFLSIETVKKHRANLMRKAKVKNLSSLIKAVHSTVIPSTR